MAQLDAWFGVGATVVTAIGGYFVQREKVNRLESDVKQLKSDQEKFVTFAHLESAMNSVKETLNNVQADVKLILEKLLR